MKRFQLLVGGEWVNPAEGAWFESSNPFNGEVWAEIPRCTPKDVDKAVNAASLLSVLALGVKNGDSIEVTVADGASADSVLASLVEIVATDHDA